jgi:hypothetical protein
MIKIRVGYELLYVVMLASWAADRCSGNDMC